MQLEKSTHIRPSWAARFDNELIAAESTRHGGVSPLPYHSLNLGFYTNDSRENVLANRRIFAHSLGFESEQLADGHQIHGDSVRVADTPGHCEGYDALVSNTPGVVLGITIADCVPVLIYDPVHKAVGAAHAGWKGTVARIAASLMDTMNKHYGCQAADCYAYIGTSIGFADFEVDNDVAQHFESPFKIWDASKGKFFVDLPGNNRAQLEAMGVPSSKIEQSPYSTVKDNTHFFSHRAERGSTGRSLAVIGLVI